MIKTVILFTSTIFMITFVTSAQNDPQAEQILDSFSSVASKAPSVNMDFTMVTTDLAEKTADTLIGSVMLSSNMYRLTLGENITWFDGETTWNYLTAENEVTITKPDKKDHSFQNHPSEIFTMYKSGYKSRLIGENGGIYTVDLYPVNIKSDLVRVRLYIRKIDMNLVGFEYKRRDGVIINLIVGKYDLRQKPDQNEFVFPAAKFRGAEVNDMR